MSAPATPPLQTHEWRGMMLGFIGVAIFSVTLPATRTAVVDWSPVIVGLGRALVAAVLAIIILVLTRQPWPKGRQWFWLIVTSLGVVFGFPLFSAMAMEDVPAAHGAVVLGVLPLATAVGGVLIGGERPSMGFWLVAAIGSAAVVAFALLEGAGSLVLADIWLFLAVAAAGIGYAAGGVLSRDMGGWQVICWALVISIPGLLPPVLWELPDLNLSVGWRTWAGFAYVTLFSQLVGFFAWNAGLALGGVARVGQVQLLQTFLTLGFAALLLGEPITAEAIGFAALVVAMVWLGRRMAVARLPAAR